MSMVMVITENVTPRLRGRLGIWLLEIRAGVYVGNHTNKTRNMIWDHCKALRGDGNIVLCFQTNNDCGFDCKTLGDNRRRLIDHDDIPMIEFV